MLPEEISKIPEANYAVWLFFVCLFFDYANILMGKLVPGRERVTVRVPPPIINDFDCGSSLV